MSQKDDAKNMKALSAYRRNMDLSPNRRTLRSAPVSRLGSRSSVQAAACVSSKYANLRDRIEVLKSHEGLVDALKVIEILPLEESVALVCALLGIAGKTVDERAANLFTVLSEYKPVGQS